MNDPFGFNLIYVEANILFYLVQICTSQNCNKFYLKHNLLQVYKIN